jgi:hypothetical protein
MLSQTSAQTHILKLRHAHTHTRSSYIAYCLLNTAIREYARIIQPRIYSNVITQYIINSYKHTHSDTKYKQHKHSHIFIEMNELR